MINNQMKSVYITSFDLYMNVVTKNTNNSNTHMSDAIFHNSDAITKQYINKFIDSDDVYNNKSILAIMNDIINAINKSSIS